MEGGDVAATAAGEAARNGASLSSVAAPLLPAVERSHTAAEPALQPPHSLLIPAHQNAHKPHMHKTLILYQLAYPQ